MAGFEAGAEYVKTAGRDAGSVVKVVKVLSPNFVEVEVQGSKKPSRCNVRHLVPADSGKGKSAAKKQKKKKQQKTAKR